MDLQELKEIILKFRQRNVLVIGDLMVDEYLWGNVDRISPEAPVQVVDIEKDEYTLGGAGNVVKNLVSLKANVYVASVIDDKEYGSLILRELNKLGVFLGGLFKDSNRISSKKTRIISSANNQQILRVDRETRSPIGKNDEKKIINFVKANIDKFEVIIISDYMKGVLTRKVLKNIIRIARRCYKPTIVDPKGEDYRKYQRSTIITPNKKEAEAASKLPIENEDDLRKIGRKLLEEIKTDAILITRGKEGMSLFENEGKIINIPTRAKEVYDIAGAGDTVVSVLGLGIASGLTFKNSAEIANIAAGIVVGKVGTATVTGQEIFEYYNQQSAHFSDKLKEIEELKSIVEQEKAKGKTMVFTNGCFDLLHVGHIKYLREAKLLGDILILGLNSDNSVRRLKGNKRPLVPEKDRAHILSALNCIDYITIFDEDTPLELIMELKPDILVKGKDYKKSEVVGWEVVKSYGGRIELIDLVQDVSTSAMIDKILGKGRNV
jgi:D-beta-D-heptose 7-phosphate kinase/D-beta-D-heptose 1-phosphate adenosyltransferase